MLGSHIGITKLSHHIVCLQVGYFHMLSRELRFVRMHNLLRFTNCLHLNAFPPPSVIAQGHVGVKYAHYVLDFYPSVANHRMGYFAKPPQDLEKPTTSLSHALFEDFNLISILWSNI